MQTGASDSFVIEEIMGEILGENAIKIWRRRAKPV